MGEALERMLATRTAIQRLDDIHLAIMFECEDWKPPTPKRPGIGDPTANKAIYRAEELTQQLKALETEKHELEEYIGTTLRLLERVRDGLGVKYGNILEWLYIDGLTWSEIRLVHGIPKSTGNEWRNVALDWIDSIGIKEVLKGASLETC